MDRRFPLLLSMLLVACGSEPTASNPAPVGSSSGSPQGTTTESQTGGDDTTPSQGGTSPTTGTQGSDAGEGQGSDDDGGQGRSEADVAGSGTGDAGPTSDDTSTPPATVDPSTVDCMTLRAITGRENDPTKNAVAFVFSVTSCEGEPIVGLKTEDFAVYEDDAPIVASEAGAVILDRSADAFITLVLDNSPSVAAAEGVDAVTDAAIAYADKVMQDTGVKVGVYFFSKKLEEKVAHTSDKAAVLAALESYRSDDTGSNTTNLYGSLIAVLDEASAAQSAFVSKQQGGVLLLGQTVMFTDGSDLAAVNTLEEAQAAVANAPDKVTMVAFGPDADAEILSSLSTGQSFVSPTAEGLGSLFSQAGDQVLNERKSIYVLGYCSPKLAGMHTVKVAVPGKGTSPALSFNAEGWLDAEGEECSTDAFIGACEDKQCGGLWCGSCAGACGEDLQCFCDDPTFVGIQCDECANEAHTGPGCDTCAQEHTLFPECLLCEANYYPTGECSTFCEASDTCHGHGTCNEAGGCECVDNWSGEGCDTCVLGFDGPDCAVCAADYFPEGLCDTVCVAADTCSGHGTCQADGSCLCDIAWAGAACNTCAEGFAGDACESCPGTGTLVSEDGDCDGITTALDCDDNDASLGAKADDDDCDGVLTSKDCDDSDPQSTTKAEDQDCDGLITAVDCDDDDPNATSKAEDGDCDGTLSAQDCDDSDPDSLTLAEDGDCDGALTLVDCDDSDPNVGSTPGDADCDGVDVEEDCDDTDANSTTKANDKDCDGTLAEGDCDDEDPNSTIMAIDKDCDGTPAAGDCDDEDPNSNTLAIDGDCDGFVGDDDCDDDDAQSNNVTNDADCDGTLAGEDCDDSDPGSTVKAVDADCDGTPDSDDCAPGDASIGHTATLAQYGELVTQAGGTFGESVTPDGLASAPWECSNMVTVDEGYGAYQLASTDSLFCMSWSEPELQSSRCRWRFPTDLGPCAGDASCDFKFNFQACHTYFAHKALEEETWTVASSDTGSACAPPWNSDTEFYTLEEGAGTTAVLLEAHHGTYTTCAGGVPIKVEGEVTCSGVNGAALCVPTCGDATCGSNGCGGSCGSCGDNETCVEGSCEAEVCSPNCSEKSCGDDGCGGSCGSCAGDEICVEGSCQGACTPSCAEKSCGDDGCGGSCGSCAGDEICVEGSCQGVEDGCQALPIPGALIVDGFYLASFFVPLNIIGPGSDKLELQFFTEATGTFALDSEVNANYASCEQCVLVYMDVDEDGSPDKTFFQTAGVMEVSASSDVTYGPLEVTLEGVELREVTIESGSFVSSLVPNGQCYVLESPLNLQTE